MMIITSQFSKEDGFSGYATSEHVNHSRAADVAIELILPLTIRNLYP